jgi:transcriptional regulator GlxA family with amidase domain
MARIVVVAFDGAQTLDVVGPAEVFAGAGRLRPTACYPVVLASIGGGERQLSSWLRVATRDLGRIRPQPDDIVVVAGGDEQSLWPALTDERLLDWLRRAAPVVARMTSVCSGAFILAAAGLLDGKRAATHWAGCERLQRTFPRVQVDANAIFVRDGKTWTSAGVTTGIDMALAIVEEDCGRALADAIAARMVLYVRRPGFQSQCSDALVAQSAASDPLGPAIAWARAHLGAADVESLARHAGLSVRTLHRRCLALLGTTPKKLLDKLRVEHARTLLAGERLPQKTLAAQSGFGNAVRLNRAFYRELGIAPRAYHILHAAAPPKRAAARISAVGPASPGAGRRARDNARRTRGAAR